MTETEMLAKHERLIAHIARPYRSRSCPMSDLMQEGRLALLSASRMFRPDEGAQLWTYAYKFVLGAISVKARREHSEPARPRDRHDEGQGLYGAYRVLLAMPDADAESPEVAAETRELCALVSDSVLCLSDQERRALGFRFVDELGVRDVAASLGLPRSTASDLLQGALKKLRERLTPWSL